jgi:hypothetical protein
VLKKEPKAKPKNKKDAFIFPKNKIMKYFQQKFTIVFNKVEKYPKFHLLKINF